MRDRLIELLEAECGFSRYMTDDERRAKLADHLLASGVIVPPVQVGQTVYVVNDKTGKIYDGKIVRLEYNLYTEPKEWIVVNTYYPLYGWYEGERERIDMVIGNTVFFTREEAEKALAERKKG